MAGKSTPPPDAEIIDLLEVVEEAPAVPQAAPGATDDLNALLAELAAEASLTVTPAAAATAAALASQTPAPPAATQVPAAPTSAALALKVLAVPAGLPLEEARAIFERVAREAVERIVGQLVPKLVAEEVAREIEAIKRQAASGQTHSVVG